MTLSLPLLDMEDDPPGVSLIDLMINDYLSPKNKTKKSTRA